MGEIKTDYKDYVIGELAEYEDLQAFVLTAPERIAGIRYDMAGIKAASTDKDPVHGGTSRREERIVGQICEIDMLERNLERAKRKIEEINFCLGHLSAIEKKTLINCYILRKRSAIQDICTETGYEKTQIYRIRDRALTRFARVYAGAGDG